MREFDDDFEQEVVSRKPATQPDDELTLKPSFFSQKLNKLKVHSLNMPETDLLLDAPVTTPFMSMPLPPPHSVIDDLAQEIYAKRHESNNFD